MSEDCHDSNNHIVACCAHCGYMFDATQGLECSNCKRKQIAYAWKSDQPAEFWRRKEWDEQVAEEDEPGFATGRVPDFRELSPYAHVLNRHGTDCIPECDACMWAEEQAREKRFAQPSIAECERIFSLQDPRN